MKTFLIMFSLCLLYVYPIVSADRFYIDDLGRSIRGYAGWSENGRPLADLIMIAVYFGMPMVDISPLPLIAGIFIFCISVSIYLNSVGTAFNDIQRALIGLAFICNPFFLENLSYKYDALTMLLSVSLLFLSFTFKRPKYYIAPIILVVCSLSLYQASLTVFCSLAIIEFSLLSSSKDDFISRAKVAVLRVVQLSIAYLFYSQLIAKIFITGGYNDRHSQSIFSFNNPLKLLKSNTDSYVSIISSYYHKMPDIVFYAFIASTLAIAISSIIKRSKNGRWAAYNIIITAISFILIYTMTFAHLATLKNPIYAPRVMISFGCVLMYFLLISTHKRYFYIPASILIAYSFVLSFSYGNAMKSQGVYEDYIKSSVSYDINRLNYKSSSISFVGEMPKSEGLKLAIHKYPILRKLVPIHINNNWVWGGVSLLHYGTALSHKSISDSDIAIICKTIPRVETKLYSIFTLNESVIVMFDKSKC
ncbi:glucosyltransferase domain-containing protein [Escherichia albertii]|uniref:glucosyltransferase domain-containing protein n=1 Tax=Escherichia albertii TaxID=208962 RepID=UPI0016A3CD92|nr:glucosyltransferase domain-containing protein [Escherichia albertii]UUL28203.1 glucosyltransferase domain-containing protein [Escherichia albertii]UUL28255.1 glucosyltransferase domain-containing protein [Escherichia albertii]